jgi:hypothetical protein
MLQGLSGSHALLGIDNQQVENEINGIIRDVIPILGWEVKVCLQDGFEEQRNLFVIEWWETTEPKHINVPDRQTERE